MNKTSIKQGTLYLTVASLLFVISGYLINIWLGRFLGPSAYGVYGVIISLMTAINLTQTAGLPQAVAKFVAEDEIKADSILKSGLILQIYSTVIVSIIFFFLAPFIANLLNDMSLTPYIRTVAAVFPFYGVYSVYLNYYNGSHSFKTQAFMGITYSTIKLFAVVLLVYFFKVYGAIFGFIISPFVALLFFLHNPKNIKINFSYKKLILFSLPLIGVAIFSNLLQSIDLFFVKGFLHIDKLTGYYTANQNIAEIPFYGVVAISSILFPSISRHVSQNKHDEAKNLIAKSLRVTLLIIIPSVLLISATSSEILRFLYSTKYISGANSLSILSIANLFFTLFIVLTTIISGSGNPLKSSILAGVGLILCSLLCLILIPLYGLNGAALSTTIASFIVMVGASVIVYRKFGVLFPLKSLVKIIMASLLVYFLARFLLVPTLLLPILYIVLFVIYFGLLFLLKEITQDDIKVVSDLRPKWLVNKIK